MDFIDHVNAISQQIQKLKDQVLTEEATKNAFILPLINALGYNVFNPMEVCPEFTADMPGLIGKKVDYAIIIDNNPAIFIECKWCGSGLENPKQSSQLHSYFHATDAKFGVLTNGILYRFYTDIEKTNVMDEKPFFEFNMLDYNESTINELKRFSKSAFNSNEMGEAARNLLYIKEIKRLLIEQLIEPSPAFVKFFASQVYSGTLVASVMGKFTGLVKYSLKEFINDRITDRLKSAIELPDPANSPSTSTEEQKLAFEVTLPENGIITTEEEMEAFYIVKSILREVIDISCVQYKDTKSYFGINLNGKSFKTICRFRLSSNKKIIGLLDLEGKEAMKTISSLDEIYGVAEILKDRAKYLSLESYPQPSTQT